MGSGTTNSAAFDSTPSTLPRISVVTRATASASAFLEMSLRRGDGVMVGASQRTPQNALLEPLEPRRFGLRRPDLVRNSFKLELVVRQPRFVRRDFVRRAALDGRQPPQMLLDLLEIRLRREAPAHLRHYFFKGSV